MNVDDIRWFNYQPSYAYVTSYLTLARRNIGCYNSCTTQERISWHESSR